MLPKDTSPDKIMTQGDGKHLATIDFMRSYPAGLPFRVNSFLAQRQGLQQSAKFMESFHFDAKKASLTKEKEVHLLVIGETVRADRWQLNGYYRETTPKLSKIKNIINLDNTITGWSATRMSVPVIITRKKSNNTNIFFPEKSIVSAFKEAGFKTYWLSAQGPLGMHDSSTALYAAEADKTQYLNLTDYNGGNIYDDILIKPLEAILSRNEPKQFIVLHTLGSHYNYADRYPNSFDKFKPSLKHEKNISLFDKYKKKEINNSYDNSILYTDYFLSEVINRLKHTGKIATLLYTADHGENLFDNQCKLSGHGYSTENDFRVASIWWNSDQYKNIYPRKVATIKKHQSSPLTTEHVFHTLLDIADIRYPTETLAHSIASDSWKSSPRWTAVGLDFDKSGRDSICQNLVKIKQTISYRVP
jgi:glucan phosphoethanolaminetransferase (alkaline phosphatase superfamily)